MTPTAIAYAHAAKSMTPRTQTLMRWIPTNASCCGTTQRMGPRWSWGVAGRAPTASSRSGACPRKTAPKTTATFAAAQAICAIRTSFMTRDPGQFQLKLLVTIISSLFLFVSLKHQMVYGIWGIAWWDINYTWFVVTQCVFYTLHVLAE